MSSPSFSGMLRTLGKDVRRKETLPFAIGFGTTLVLAYMVFGNDHRAADELKKMTWRSHLAHHGDDAHHGGEEADHGKH
eukprot:CAMPEP_0184682532 /NCGR_PEP_ID=MMETSP0312-20130426/7609_1 /TAXON_ID=31354 /ORGANISM="Compsopogon coeruleus, Strain SAG 36.94" /LENGTH=78 /DNA_ID=CAMNT_0027134251 /DNA_START=170 /DNA_END=406 /DNA_ORIENTATION=-